MILGLDPLIAAGVLASTATTDAAYVFFNAAVVGTLYSDLGRQAGMVNGDLSIAAESLAQRIIEILSIARLPATLSACGVAGGILPLLAEEAAQQWTGRFNPRPVSEADLLNLYESAL